MTLMGPKYPQSHPQQNFMSQRDDTTIGPGLLSLKVSVSTLVLQRRTSGLDTCSGQGPRQRLCSQGGAWKSRVILFLRSSALLSEFSLGEHKTLGEPKSLDWTQGVIVYRGWLWSEQPLGSPRWSPMELSFSGHVGGPNLGFCGQTLTPV